MAPVPKVSHFFDLSDRAKLRVRGADAARYLQGQITNDVRRATANVAVYACVLTAKGRLCADLYLRADQPGGFLLDADATLRESLAARLERYIIADDVTVDDVTDELGLLHLVGAPPAAAPGNLSEPALADRFGEPGMDVFLPAGETLTEFKAMLHDQGYLEITAEAAETRRIAAGVPRWGAELDEDTLPPEAGLEARAISYDKGCYVGQETISRLKSIGHVNRHLRRLRAVGSHPLRPGFRLHELPADGGIPGREVGRVTSVAGNLALGYVRRGLEAAHTRLRATDPENPTAAPCEVEVVAPPSSPTPA